MSLDALQISPGKPYRLKVKTTSSMFYCLYYVFFQDFKTLKQPGSPFSSHTSSYLTMAVSDTHFVHLLQTNFPNVTFSPLLEKNNSHLSSMKTNHLFFHGL